MSPDDEKRAQELAGRIQGNVRSLRMGGFYEHFMQAQRRNWAEISRQKECIRARVNEVLHPERKAVKA